MTDSDFERRLIEALQPVRGFVLAQVLHFAMRSPLWERLSKGEESVSELAPALDLDPERLKVVLDYLANEGYVLRHDAQYALSDRGESMTTFAPWYRLFVGGYTPTFQSIAETLRADAPYAQRDATAVGEGSCGISAYDAIPLVRSLLGQLPRPVARFVDLGCGDGQVLLALASDLPSAQLVGVDPHAESIANARASAEARGLPAEFEVGDGASYARSAPGVQSVCYLTAFVLQEILEQRGRGAVVDMVRDVIHSAEHAYLVAVEVDWQISNPTVMRHGLGLAYYNPYYLVHGLTEQRLQSREFWRQIAADAGGYVLATGEVDSTVDSTTMEFGLLIGAWS